MDAPNPNPLPENTTAAPLTDHRRLSLPFPVRLPASASVGAVAGLFLGLSHGTQTAGFRFRAENAHRLPTTSTGWYLYHKSKNYHMMLGGIKEGLKMAGKMGFWVGGFFTIEEAIDCVRGGRTDFLSTVVAGLSVAGGFSLWNRLPVITAARTVKVGLLGGLGLGLVQDALGLARGRRLAYLDFLLGKNRRQRDMMG